MIDNKVLFSGFFGTGFVLLLVLRLYFDSPTWLTVLILCVLILAYTWISWAQHHFLEERAADNLYYMGFLFTVCTLGVSLIRFSAQEDGLINHIVGDLGIGLSTTVLGLFLRVLFLKRESSEQIEYKVREELVEVAEATIQRIRLTADIVEEGQIATRQALEEMNTSVKAASNKLVANTNLLEKRVSDMINIPPDLLSSQLSPALDTASQSITRFTSQMDKIEIPDDLITSRANQIFANLTETIEEGQIATRQAIDGMNTSIKAATTKLVANVDRLDERISAAINIPSDMVSSRLSPALDSASQSITKFTNQMEKIEIPDDLIISRTNQAFARLAESMGMLTDQISVDVLKHLSDVLDTDQAQNLIQQIEKSLIERFQAIEIPAEQLTQRIEPVLDQVNSSTRVFVNRMQNLSSSLEDTQQQLMKCNSYIATLNLDNVRSVVDALDAIDLLLKNVQETIDTQRNLSSAHNQHLSDLSNKAEALSAVIEDSLSGLSDLNNSLDALRQDTKEQAKPKTRWPWSR